MDGRRPARAGHRTRLTGRLVPLPVPLTRDDGEAVSLTSDGRIPACARFRLFFVVRAAPRSPRRGLTAPRSPHGLPWTTDGAEGTNPALGPVRSPPARASRAEQPV